MSDRTYRAALIVNVAAAMFMAGFWIATYFCRTAAMEAGVGYYEGGHFHYGVQE